MVTVHCSQKLNVHPGRARELSDDLPLVPEANLSLRRLSFRRNLQRGESRVAPREADAEAATEARVLDGAARPVGGEGREDVDVVDVGRGGHIWDLDQAVLQFTTGCE